MNSVQLIGNLTDEPELKITGTGVSVCKFTIAINRSYKNAQGERETDFLNIVTWRGLADNCAKYLSKGSKVAVVGQIQTRTYEVEGQKRYANDILADEVEFLSRASSASGTSGAEDKPKPSDKLPELKPVEDETLPF